MSGRNRESRAPHVLRFCVRFLGVRCAKLVGWFVSMSPPPSLRFRFLTNAPEEVSRKEDAPTEDLASPPSEGAPPSSRRRRLTARQEWLDAELSQIDRKHRVA